LLACIDKPPKSEFVGGFFLSVEMCLFEAVSEAFIFLAVWACVLAARANIINRFS
jgi:hypothetical protein